MKYIAYSLLLSLFMLLTGCQSLRELESPDVTLADINLESASLLQQHWALTLSVLNPNDRNITINSLDYEVYLNGARFARGLTGEKVVLNAMSETQVKTRISTNVLSSLKQLQKVQHLQGKPLDYRLTGKARVAGSPIPLHFDQDGQITVPNMPVRP